MWWNFIGRTHEEVAGFREEWESGSERFGRVEGYRGQVQRLPAPPMPTVRIKPRLSPTRPRRSQRLGIELSGRMCLSA